MEYIIRNRWEYSFGDFIQASHADPSLNGISFELWTIKKHEEALGIFIARHMFKKKIAITGTVWLDSVGHRVKPKTLSIPEAFNAMLTPDTQDFSISRSGNYYYVTTKHSRGKNVFKFYMND